MVESRTESRTEKDTVGKDVERHAQQLGGLKRCYLYIFVMIRIMRNLLVLCDIDQLLGVLSESECGAFL